MFRQLTFIAVGFALVGFTPAAIAQCRVAKVQAAAAQDFVKFGSSVAVSGHRLVVGAPDVGLSGLSNGAAYVYELTSGSWMQTAVLSANDGMDFDGFGISVAIDGDTILVGADGVDGPLSGAVGAVYAFEWNGAQWMQTQKFQCNDGDSGGFFGCTVALVGDTAVVGRFWDSDAALHAGSAYVFRRNGSTWSQFQKLLPTQAHREDNFGFAVAMSADRIVIGAPERFWSGPSDMQLGRVFVYALSGGAWTQQSVLTASNATPQDQFGISVAIDGDELAVGAWQDFFSPSMSGNGKAFVFDWTGSAWQESQSIVAFDGALEDEFGASVAIRGPWLLVGAPSRSSSFPLWGGTYVYQKDATGWNLATLLLPDPNPSLSWFGNAVALDGNYALAGAFIESSGANTQNGTAYVYGGFAAWKNEGGGLAGASGVPQLAGSGTLCPGTSGDLLLSNARPNSIALLIRGHAIANTPFLGGTLIPSKDFLQRGFVTDASGSVFMPNVWPAMTPTGRQFFYQAWIRDSTGPQGASASNAVSGTAP